MCSRYYIDEEMAEEIDKDLGGKMKVKSAGDIYPSQPAIVLTGRYTHLKKEEMIWGFPQYQKSGLLINARAETVLERKTFRDSVLHRRCIIPAKHFYEWDSGKNKAAFFRHGEPVLYMAGFYNRFPDSDRFIIITTEANESVRQVHDRMPLVLEKEELESWVYDDRFLEVALHKVPPRLDKSQEYEQLTLFSGV